jgi:hypothetical protein
MKKLLILLVFCSIALNVFTQTVFNAAFEKIIKPTTTLGKRDTSFIDTIYLSTSFVQFTVNRLAINVLAIDSIVARNNILYNSIVEIGSGKVNQKYSISKKLFNDDYIDIQSYTIAPHFENMSYTIYNVKNLIIKTRLVIGQTAAPTTPVIYIHYNINASYF